MTWRTFFGIILFVGYIAMLLYVMKLPIPKPPDETGKES